MAPKSSIMTKPAAKVKAFDKELSQIGIEVKKMKYDKEWMPEVMSGCEKAEVRKNDVMLVICCKLCKNVIQVSNLRTEDTNYVINCCGREIGVHVKNDGCFEIQQYDK